MLHFMEFGIFVECSFKIAQGDEKAGPTIEKSLFKDIHMEKRPDAMRQCGAHGRLSIALAEFFRPQAGVTVGFVYHLGKIAVRELPDRMLQVTWLPG